MSRRPIDTDARRPRATPIDAWLAHAGALRFTTERQVRDIVGNRLVCAWLHVVDTSAKGVADIVSAFHSLARRLHACNFHRARETALVCVLTDGMECYGAAAALADALPRSASFVMPSSCAAALIVFDDAVHSVHGLLHAAPAALLAHIAAHPATSTDPTLRTLTDADILAASSHIITPFARALREYPAELLPPREREPLEIAAQFFTLHTCKVWDALRSWPDMARKLPPAVVWVSTAWAPLPCVADVLPVPETSGDAPWPASLLNDTVVARALELGASRVLLISTTVLDMPQIPFVSGIDTRTGEAFVYANVLRLLARVAAGDHGDGRVRRRHARVRRTYVEVRPPNIWPWVDATLEFRRALVDDDCSFAAADAPLSFAAAAAASSLPMFPVARNLAQARAQLGLAALADAAALGATLARELNYGSVCDDFGGVEQVLCTVGAQPPETLWRLYARLSGVPQDAVPPLAMAPTPSAANLLRARTRRASNFVWLQTQPFAVGFGTGDGACWPVVTLPPHIIQNQTRELDRITPRSLDAPATSVYFGATRFETPHTQTVQHVAQTLLRAGAVETIGNLDAAPRALLAALCRYVGPHPTWVDARIVCEPPLLLFAQPHRLLLSAAAPPRIRVFGRDTCRFTQHARAVLRNVPHLYVPVERAAALGVAALQCQVDAKGHKTLPCIFVDDVFLGGADALDACAAKISSEA